MKIVNFYMSFHSIGARLLIYDIITGGLAGQARSE